MIIRLCEDADAPVCEAVLRALPEWFGIETAIVQYCRAIKAMDTFVAEVDREVAGFVTLKRHNPCTTEIHLIAVVEAQHRRGIGRRLVGHVEEMLRAEKVEYLQVKTLGPSKPDRRYAGTRRFYTAMGFRPLEETNLWGPENPCLIMVKRL